MSSPCYKNLKIIVFDVLFSVFVRVLGVFFIEIEIEIEIGI